MNYKVKAKAFNAYYFFYVLTHLIPDNEILDWSKLKLISLKPYDVTPCLQCCIVGLFGENLDFNMDRIVIMREEYLKSAILTF